MKNKILTTALLLCVFGCQDKKVSLASDYDEYRKNNPRPVSTISNKRAGNSKIVEINLDTMSFGKAFNIQHRAKGEGHTFWWKSNEYTTDIKKEGE